MAGHPQHQRLRDSRDWIAERVRLLRKSRQLSQRELAARLGLSQSRLSEIERGGGSFTAEQLLEILTIFNVEIGEFFATPPPVEGEVQNALVRFGAYHLRQVPHVGSTGRYRSPADVVVAVLLDPFSERFVTALAPVLQARCDDISLPALQAEVARAGRPSRLPWLADNTVHALDTLLSEPNPLEWRRQARRAHLVLRDFLAHLSPDLPGMDHIGRDTLDRGTRTSETLERLWEHGSTISRRWNIVSAIQVDDFVDALRSAREHH